ncbi:LacI family transcriptional regulator [Pedobacter yulinensis]|uniref:LacI family transcriptional regulator n=1 Tax=Pedobacter yulinensis TaxID=2126353 RepID=A0A2T3HJH9_9SPHI|nr:LacI family DNA-binding transcriptional regulator [Pedobacter yulinensis]PST82594.1 LacI family transcriptional regulator [Pedobacter yulinensis]
MKRNVTVKTLAEQLNISIATVSKALSDSHEISAETKQRVLDLARTLNYERNPAASNLRSHRTSTIAVIIPDVANNFFSLAIKGIEEIARTHNHHVLIYQTHEDSAAEIAFTNSLISGRVDGILISVTRSAGNLAHFQSLIRQIPVVFFDRSIEIPDAFSITTDDYESAYQATRHLAEKGCRKIIFLQGLDRLATGQRRLRGYLDALNDSGLEQLQPVALAANTDPQLIRDGIRQAIIGEKPDGVLSSIEEFVVPCYYVCRELGIDMPGALKLVSFSNLPTAPLLHPALSTITQPAFEMGRVAASCLFQILHKREVDLLSLPGLHSQLIERESSALV